MCQRWSDWERGSGAKHDEADTAVPASAKASAQCNVTCVRKHPRGGNAPSRLGLHQPPPPPPPPPSSFAASFSAVSSSKAICLCHLACQHVVETLIGSSESKKGPFGISAGRSLPQIAWLFLASPRVATRSTPLSAKAITSYDLADCASIAVHCNAQATQLSEWLHQIRYCEHAGAVSPVASPRSIALHLPNKRARALPPHRSRSRAFRSRNERVSSEDQELAGEVERKLHSAAIGIAWKSVVPHILIITRDTDPHCISASALPPPQIFFFVGRRRWSCASSRCTVPCNIRSVAPFAPLSHKSELSTARWLSSAPQFDFFQLIFTASSSRTTD